MDRPPAAAHSVVDYLEGLMEGFVAYDAGWRMTYMNGSAERILSRSRADVLGQTWQQAFPHAVGNPVDLMYRRVMANRAAERMEYYYPHYQRWLEISASPLSNGGVGVYFQDISARKLAEEKLRTLAAVVEKSGDFIGLCTPDMVPFYLNEAGRNMVGLGARDVSQTAVLDYFWPDDRQRIETEAVPAVLSQGRWSGEVRFRHLLTGAPIHTRWNAFVIRDEAGQPIAWATISPNLDAMKRAEEALQRANDELRESARRKDEFLATLAHELRNPLAPIANAVEILGLKLPADETLESARGVIERQVGLMVRLIDDLLDVSRITSGKLGLRKRRVALAGVVEQALETSRPHVRGHEFTVSLPPQPVFLEADPVRLAQVLSNLLNNACKYTPSGGQIRLTAERADGRVIVRVRDNGIGIAREHLPHVFDMFSQAAPALERAQGGLGIGLALARALTQLHEGSIEAHSEGANAGSEFVVSLPAFDEGPEPRHKRESFAATSTARRILVVDDNRDSATSLALLLRMAGHAVEVANDGPGAIQAASSYKPDLILLDIGLPGMNGYDACRAIRALPGGQTIVIGALTGWGQQEDHRRSREAGFDAHLVKPVEQEALLALIAASRATRTG